MDFKLLARLCLVELVFITFSHSRRSHSVHRIFAPELRRNRFEQLINWKSPTVPRSRDSLPSVLGNNWLLREGVVVFSWNNNLEFHSCLRLSFCWYKSLPSTNSENTALNFLYWYEFLFFVLYWCALLVRGARVEFFAWRSWTMDWSAFGFRVSGLCE